MKKFYILAFLSLITLTSCLKTDTSTTNRKPEHKVMRIITDRWSARAMSGAVSDEDLNRLFEAAKWAPSSYNSQPWRFIYAKSTDKEWPKLFNLLVDFNKSWVKNAGALILVVSAKNFPHNNELSRTHSFDTGAAVENMALQATSMNLVFHGMSGFDYDAAKKEFNISDDYQVEAMFAVGKPSTKDVLPEYLRDKEEPATRNPISKFVFHGCFESK